MFIFQLFFIFNNVIRDKKKIIFNKNKKEEFLYVFWNNYLSFLFCVSRDRN